MRLTTPCNPASELAARLRQLRRERGEEHAVFVDAPWSASPAGLIDLFLEFSRHRRRSIELSEALLWTGRRMMGVYFIPQTNVQPFAAFLHASYVPLPDGSIVCP